MLSVWIFFIPIMNFNFYNFLLYVVHSGFMFFVLNLVVFEILWADDNWFSSIITLLQYPTASYTNITNYVNPNYKWVRYPFWISFSTTNTKSYVKGDQAYTYNLQPWVTIFPRLYLILLLCYVDRYIHI